MFDKAKLRDILGPRILEVLTEINDGPPKVFLRVNGIGWIFEQAIVDQDDSRFEDAEGTCCADPRPLTPSDKVKVVEQASMIVRFDHRCTRADCNRKTCREHADVLYALGKRTGKVVFEIGTDASDSYEPVFLFYFSARGKTPDWMKP